MTKERDEDKSGGNFRNLQFSISREPPKAWAGTEGNALGNKNKERTEKIGWLENLKQLK